MKITESLMRPGSWALTMKAGTPQSVLDEIRGAQATWDATNDRWSPVLRGQIVVFDTDTFVPSLDTARYTGILMEQTGARSFAGPGLAAYMQKDNGLSPYIVTASTDLTFTNDIEEWLDLFILYDANGLTKGTVTLTGLGDVTLPLPPGVGTREMWDAVCVRAGAEYRVNPDGTIDAAKDLFVTTPTVVVTDQPTGESGTPRGIAGYVLSPSVDSTQVATQAEVFGASRSASSSATGGPATIGKALDGTTLKYSRVVDAPDVVDFTAAGSLAATIRDLWKYPRSSFGVQTVSEYVRRSVEPGDLVHVWFPDAGIRGGSLLSFRGETIFPHTVRVQSIAWGVHDGHGVYLREHDGTTESWLRLTDYVEWSAPTARWSVGTGGGLSDRTSLTGVARLGDDEPAPQVKVAVPSPHTGKTKNKRYV